jgi:hypothetical protein
MRIRFRTAGGLFLLMTILLMAACDENATEPEETFDVTNDNEHCGLAAGYIVNASGEGLPNARVSISPVPGARSKGLSADASLSSFINYPNPFTTDTYFAYYLTGTEEHTVSIRVYDLHQNLLRQFEGVPGTEGAHLFYFDGLDDQEESLPNGLMPCEIVSQHPGGTDSLYIALAKGINISDQGGLESYSVGTGADGLYIIDDLPLEIRLMQTTTFAPQAELVYPENWPYTEVEWVLSNRFIVLASKPGYTAAGDTVTLSPGGVSRLDLTLQ